MIHRLSHVLTRFAARWVPDPFTLAVMLTLATLLLAWAAHGFGTPWHLVGYWGGRLRDGELLARESGLWKLLAFGMQMCLILVTGHALASSKPVRRFIDRIATLPHTQAQALTLTALVAMITALLNWGLGLIVGALLAREVGLSARSRGLKVHYPLLGAAGYTGLLVWHGGLSGSAPLTVTQAKDLGAVLGRPDMAPITLAETIFSPLNIAVTLSLLIAVPLFLVLMAPSNEDEIVEVPAMPSDNTEPVTPSNTPMTPARWLDESPILAWFVALLCFSYLAMYLGKIGFNRIDLNAINLLFVGVGILLNGSTTAYGRAIGEATRSCSGIILQFPFYAGIMGIMALGGMIETMSSFIVAHAGSTSLGPLTMLSAGLVNIFVPSGGGQWAIQGPLVLESAFALGVEPGKAVMAFAYGDEWTNMLQPFWALPLLGITGLSARDLMGYTACLMLLVAPIIILCILLF
jgi:short-chain fatty acids transporter